MIKNSNKMKIGRRTPLVKNLLLVEGPGRSGKFVLANIITGFQGVEPIQYYDLLEHLPFLEKFGFIKKTAAQELIRATIDTHSFEMLLGRGFNYRRKDLSSIFNHPLYKKYLQRAKQSDWDMALKKFKKENPYSLYIAHELMPNIEIYFEMFPNLKVISLQRSPVSLVNSWLKKSMARRFGSDPRLMNILLDHKSGPTPWFINGWQEEYNRLSETDRTIKTILSIQKMYEKALRRLRPEWKKKILMLRFEDVLLDAPGTIKKIGKFLKRKPLPGIRKIYQNLIFSSPADQSSRGGALRKIQQAASPKYQRLLLAAEKAYCHEK